MFLRLIRGCLQSISAASLRRSPPHLRLPFHTNGISTTAPLRMLDINLFREERGHDPEIIRESQRRRFADEKMVDEVIELDKEWRRKQFELSNLSKESNSISKEIGRLKISGADDSEIRKRADDNKQLKLAKAAEVKAVLATLNEKLMKIGNIVHDSVPFGEDEEKNKIIRTWGETEKRTVPKLRDHVELVELLGMADFKRGSKVAGSRGHILVGNGDDLDFALMSYGRDFLKERGYTPMKLQSFMRKEVMAKCTQLAQFDDELYQVDGSDIYLIATAEQPLCGSHMDDWIHPSELPSRFLGRSSCFRKEAGSHGRDTLGLFRTHEFEKLEQFCITSPNGNDSWDMFEEMITISEEFYQSLGLPYQVVAIASGALNDSAAKKYDLEAWFPASGKYRELVSCSNCTDYQSRKLEIRYGQKTSEDQVKQYAHLLNCTLTATGRTLCCILENYQTEDGLVIPKVLQPYMRKTFVPFEEETLKGRPRKRLNEPHSHASVLM